ncbi:MAG: arginase family protein [Solirubrobacterales bacterium]|nr:arginase family protein [Solirubrobacterales bacterium]
MDQDRLTLLGVPIDSVGRRGGTELGPATLREIFKPLGLRDAGDTEQRIRGLNRDPTNGWLAYPEIVKLSAEVRGRVATITANGEVPVVLGGCCTLLPGTLAGASDSHGKLGLAYLDGHLDLFTGQTSPTGEGADMPLATILGLAPPELVETIGPVPVVDASRIACLGSRDEEELGMIAPLPNGLGIGRIEDRETLRHADLEHVARSVAEELTADGSHFWLHLDVDILDPNAFPATDYLMPDGLSVTELKALLGPLAGSRHLAGINITCFNPEKDQDGSCCKTLVEMLKSTLIT